ncbi:MAG: hypothetical protein LBS54_07955 [Dysgonamonadaceae bacterium]|jgi:hypothetical protein|nr:hypothetical protein [Dysgonamonadaceae bacterium]
MDFFCKYLLNRKIKRRLNLQRRQRKFQNLKGINTVLVLFDVEDCADVEDFVKILKLSGKRVLAVAFKYRKIANYPFDIEFIVTEKDINFTKSETVSAIETMLEGNIFDLVVDMVRNDNPLMKYVLVSANALLKVGIHKSNLHIHDILILSPSGEENTSVKEFGKQIIYYLSTIS